MKEEERSLSSLPLCSDSHRTWVTAAGHREQLKLELISNSGPVIRRRGGGERERDKERKRRNRGQ